MAVDLAGLSLVSSSVVSSTSRLVGVWALLPPISSAAAEAKAVDTVTTVGLSLRESPFLRRFRSASRMFNLTPQRASCLGNCFKESDVRTEIYAPWSVPWRPVDLETLW